MDDFAALDRAALDWAASAVADVGEADLGRPTPCAGWTVRDLLGHMIATNDGFAGSLAGAGPEGEVWDRLDYAGDAAEGFAVSGDRLTGALAAADPTIKTQIWPYGPVSLRGIYAMHIVDMVVHGWDVARAVGADRTPEPELASAAYKMMLRFPVEARPSRAWGLIVPVDDGASDLDKLLGYVGRTP
jgi:uncharacterized protein (TIGR03086 family)